MSTWTQGVESDEFLQEQPGREGAAPALAGVAHVGDLRLQLLRQARRKRQGPHFFAGRRRPRPANRRPALVIAHDAGGVRPQRDDARARERREIQNARRASIEPVGDRVGQRQPSLGVGVVDLDGLAGHRSDHVAELVRRPEGMFSVQAPGREPRRADSPRRQRRLRPARRPRRPCRPSCRAFPSFVFSERPPESNVTPLPIENDAASRLGRSPGEVNEARLLVGALGDGQEQPHPERRALGAAEDLDGHAGARRPGLGGGCDARGRQVAGRLVDQVARTRPRRAPSWPPGKGPRRRCGSKPAGVARPSTDWTAARVRP